MTNIHPIPALCLPAAPFKTPQPAGCAGAGARARATASAAAAPATPSGSRLPTSPSLLPEADFRTSPTGAIRNSSSKSPCRRAKSARSSEVKPLLCSMTPVPSTYLRSAPGPHLPGRQTAQRHEYSPPWRAGNHYPEKSKQKDRRACAGCRQPACCAP